MDAARARAAAGDVVAQFSLGAMLYYGSADTAQGIDWIRKAAAQRLRARRVPAWGRSTSSDSAPRRTIARRSPGTARRRSTAARRRSGRSASSIGRGAAWPPTPLKPRGGSGAPPMGMIFALNINSVRCISTVRACRAITRPRISGSRWPRGRRRSRTTARGSSSCATSPRRG